MNLLNKFCTAALCMFFTLSLTVSGFGQQEPFTYNNDDGPIFDTDIKGSGPREDNPDCYDLGGQSTGEKLGFYYSFGSGIPVSLINFPCDLVVGVTTMFGTSYNSSLQGTYNFSQDALDYLDACNSGEISISVSMGLYCMVHGVPQPLTIAEINMLFGTTYSGIVTGPASQTYSYDFELNFCCDENFDGGEISSNRSKLPESDFQVKINESFYELNLSKSLTDKKIRIDILDITGNLLSTKNLIMDKNESLIMIEKPDSQVGINIITIRTENEMLTKKVFNY